jgi:hypothetical protein
MRNGMAYKLQFPKHKIATKYLLSHKWFKTEMLQVLEQVMLLKGLHKTSFQQIEIERFTLASIWSTDSALSYTLSK